MKSPGRLIVRIVLAAACCLAVDAFAQSSSRGGRWDLDLHLQYNDSKSITSDHGSTAEVDDSVGWGFGLGYNFNDHWGLEFNASWSTPDYTATIAPGPGNGAAARQSSGIMNIAAASLNGTYNFLSSAFTPFVTAGIGATYVDTNVPDGPPTSTCWQDPWWGYYCGTVAPSKADTYFSYNAGAGLRWDSKQALFLRALVSEQWVDVGGGVGTPGFLQVRFDVGVRF
ncbi:MAG TPA: outer membrane beta-barrel protein [Burkholderiales bacterium]|nr:outer membrane beta-barrel protein [Burkholderiales bacterium]